MAIFEDGFDDGTFDAWTGTNGSPQVVSTGTPHHGTYHMLINAANEYAYKTFTEQSTVYVRFYWKYTGTTPDYTDWSDPLKLKKGATEIARVRWRKQDGTDRLRLYSAFPSEQTDEVAYTPTTDTHYYLELKFISHASTGEYRLYLNGVEKLSRTGVDTSGVSGADRIESGASDWFAGVTAVYIDCVVVDSSYIGPEAAGGLSIPVAMHHYGHHISKIIRG